MLIAYTYLLYPLVLAVLTRGIRRGELIGGTEMPSVSLIIAAFNEASVIAEKLDNIKLTDYPAEKFEALIGSDGSNDGTKGIVTSRPMKNLAFFDLPRRGKSATLNALVKEARGEILVFSDANTIYDAGAIKKLAGHFADKKVGCVCGKLLLKEKRGSAEQGESFYWKFETGIKKMESKLGAVVGANGAIYAVRKELFDPIPEKVINDDFYVSMRTMVKGFKIVYEEEAQAFEYTSGSFTREFKRHVRDGAGHYQVLPLFSGLLNPLAGWPFFCYFSHRVIRWMVPFLMIILLIFNAFLWYNIIYRALGIVQLGVYFLSLAGLVAYFNGHSIRILYIPLYFIAINLALLLGFFKWLTGAVDQKWESTPRG